MSQRYLDLLTTATREVFETMSFLEVLPKEPLEGSAVVPGVDITAVVCIAGELSGMLAVHCSKEFASECFNSITGGESKPTEAELCDTVGEIANMVAGSLKRHMSTQVDLFELSLPSISLSQGQKLFYTGAKGDFPRLLVPFVVTEEQQFYVELLYHKR
jgi:chemotaxis protein CheX